jgi:hypothetical protein
MVQLGIVETHYACDTLVGGHNRVCFALRVATLHINEKPPGLGPGADGHAGIGGLPQ